jgi:predicted nucleic acid-binding OB-fold protein
MNFRPFGDDFLGRHYVRMKNKIFKDKPRVMVIKQSGFDLMQLLPPEPRRKVPWSEVHRVVISPENDKDFMIEYTSKKAKKNLSCDSRVQLLTQLFAVYKKSDTAQFECLKLNRHGQVRA